jgi:PilZ domain
MPEYAHRREFSRVPVHLPAEIVAADAIHRDGTMENLSLKGGFFRAPHAPEEGLAVDVRLHLDGTEIVVHAQGVVVRSGPDGCAIQFSEIVGLDSLEHLRNLILFNTHEPHQVEQEFHEHLGLRPAE